MPKVSCIMPVYNTAKYLEECIDSILNQTFTDFEFIISDDGSTDWSKEIIKKYAEKDNRIIFLDNPVNRWIVANLNDCLDSASWEYIAIMESDDISMPERFEIQVKFLDENKDIGFAWWFSYTIDWEWNEIWEIKMPTTYNEIIDNLIIYQTFINPTLFFKSSLFKNFWYFNKKFDFVQDYEFITRIVYKNWIKWINLENKLIKYRVHSSSSTSNKLKKIFLLHNLIQNSILSNKKFINKIKFRIYYDRLYRFYYINSKDSKLYSFLSPLWRKYILKQK